MKKHWPKIVGALAIIAAVVLYYTYPRTSEQGATPHEAIDPAYSEFISVYTAGVISSGSPITISLSKDVVDFGVVGQAADASLFSFSPSIKGTAVWQDRRTIRFKPDGRFKSGSTYEVTFKLGKVMTVPGKLNEFSYNVQIIPQNFELTINNVKPYVKTELTRQRIEGTLTTADYAENETAEKMVSAQQEKKPLKITWTHAADGKQHDFVVEDVARQDKSNTVVITTNGEPLGIDRTDDQNVDIPALSDFKVTQVRIEQGATQHVVIQFSDPLNEKQVLAGLIAVGDLQSLDFEINDNMLHVYLPAKQAGTKTVRIEAGVENVLKYKLKETLRYELLFEPIKPSVRFTNTGTVLPTTDGMVMPFEAVNLKAVDVQIIRVFEPNVLQFLQVNDLDGNYELRRVGKPVHSQVVRLDNSGISDLGKWNRFTLDLSKMIQAEPGAIYQVKLSMRQQYMAYPCGDTLELTDRGSVFDTESWGAPDRNGSYWDEYDDGGYDYYDEEYSWSEREDPCKSSYYNRSRMVRRNLIASDLGLLAKRGSDGNTVVFVNDLRSTSPMAGVEIELYDYQQQVIGKGTTGSDGKAVVNTGEPPAFVVGKSGTQRGYLKVSDGESLSLSNFNISGERIKDGLKGFLYGERGVWRPGDSLYLSFILESKTKRLPDNHPVLFELENPEGQVTSRMVRSSSVNGFYTFPTRTDADAPTGNWTARAKVGQATFTQRVRIETVKPNRLKINLDFGKEKLTADDETITGNLKVDWLQGNPGKNLKAEFDLLLSRGETKFEKYPNYTFDNPFNEFTSEDQRIFEGSTDSEGKATMKFTIDLEGDAPGALRATFRGKVFEEGGNYSLDRFTIPYYPYSSFTGIRVPAGDKYMGMLAIGKDHKIDVVTVDTDGKPVSRDNVEMSLHKLDWQWWWDAEESMDAEYMQGRLESTVLKGSIKTVDGKGIWTMRVNDWGRYLLRARDTESGHTTGKLIYISWSGTGPDGRDGATLLSFSSDKDSYNTGEKINLAVPGSAGGRALITVENGSQVIDSRWVETQAGLNTITLDATPAMTPNCFIYITLLQPHAQTTNDLPIRMYGVIPIRVEDPETHLQPTITMPDVLEPGQQVTVRVGEAKNKTMTYTLAIVEDGLLDLTRFKTPDAWNYFYSREALGVKTWDLYNDVMGAFGGKIERLMAIGGDNEIAGKDSEKKNNRFKPVVKFLGPFTLTGGTNEHTFTMPNYIGSVRTMVVAGYEGAYGKVEKTTPVRKPLMVLATLPRVLGPEEKLKLPVTLFRMEPGIRNVKVEIAVEGAITLQGPAVQNVVMDGDDLTTEFDLLVKAQTGFGKVTIKASSGKASAVDVIDIEIRNPNPILTRVTDAIVEQSKSWSSSVVPVGLAGSNVAVLELSTLPPINLGQRLRYLIQYPYGCIEQTTSSVFPQLYLDRIKSMSVGEKATMSANITAGVQRLKSFQTSDGGFAYWPGGDDADSWGTSYGGHFLIEAEAKGYFVPQDLMRRWKSYQRTKAQHWRSSGSVYNSDLIQAYRLYTLAIAGDPDMGAMNRMHEMTGLQPAAAWMLAAAYAKAGQREAAIKYITNLSMVIKPYKELGYTFGSDLRDKAMILETLVLLDDRQRGIDLVKDISSNLSNTSSWYSTQTLAWCLKAITSYAGANAPGPFGFTYTYKGKEESIQSDQPFAQIMLPVDEPGDGALKVTSKTNGTLFVRTISEGIPSRSQEEATEQNLTLTVGYWDKGGAPVNPASLEQGTSFIVSVTVGNPGLRGSYKNIALHHVFPSGWEVNNLRLADSDDALKSDAFAYQDIRDDRVYTYFDLGPSQKKTFRYLVTASFAGKFFMPAVSAGAMYDHSISARTKGQEVDVVRKGANP